MAVVDTLKRLEKVGEVGKLCLPRQAHDKGAGYTAVTHKAEQCRL